MTAAIRVIVSQSSAPASMVQHRVAIWSFFDFLNMISPVIFAGALAIFAGALPRGPYPGDEVGRL